MRPTVPSTPADAPSHLGPRERDAWSAGFNACLATGTARTEPDDGPELVGTDTTAEPAETAAPTGSLIDGQPVTPEVEFALGDGRCMDTSWQVPRPKKRPLGYEHIFGPGGYNRCTLDRDHPSAEHVDGWDQTFVVTSTGGVRVLRSVSR